MNINSKIVEASGQYVTALLGNELDPKFVYHDINHTEDVVKTVGVISDQMNLGKHERNMLLVAAWFHDTGYIQTMEEHEAAGAVIAEEFLNEYGIEEADLQTVKACIQATRYPQKPTTLLEQILCDADMMHLSGKKFIKRNEALREEWFLSKDKTYSDEEWVELNIGFMSGHRYHTDYCKENREAKKNKNIQQLIAIRQYQKMELANEGLPEIVDQEVSRKSKKAKEKEFGRGVETLFKIASGNHMRLSGMADNKAHILLSINSIIISVVLSVLAKKLTESTFLLIPTFLLMLVCLTTIVFAVLTTRPKVSKNDITEEQLNNKEVNLLFFGHFHQLEVKAYEGGIREMMHDNDYLYKTLTRDVYFLGKVLANKYRYLNIGYMIFMYGLIASVIAFGLSFIL